MNTNIEASDKLAWPCVSPTAEHTASATCEDDLEVREQCVYPYTLDVYRHDILT